MSDILFVATLGILLTLLLSWAFRHLPEERWQMLAVVPTLKNVDNHWQGTNLTYYGFFLATSQLLSLTLLVVLLGAMHVSLFALMLVVLIILSVCMPAARLVAMAVEKKRHTFTIGGASCIGILIAPWTVMGVQQLLLEQGAFLPTMPVLAALSIAYTLGEGLGRLGCISFGCCYGKPLTDCHPLVQRLFARYHFVFHGATKKAAYEGQLAGTQLVPVQAITCVLYCCGALIGSLLFLDGHFTVALLLTIVLTQMWRILSETLRADFRGFGRITAYQKMGMLSVAVMTLSTLLLPSSNYIDPQIIHGLGVLWDPSVILGMQVLWLVFFFVFGRSTVTTATVSFDLIRKHI
jgi:hypothetical protein